MNSIRQILEEVAKEHPYKIPSRRETYDKYNEGWTDAVNRIESMLPTNVGDTISRQAAIELVMKYCTDDDGTVQCDGDIRELLDELENLPPAQPEPERTMEEFMYGQDMGNPEDGSL